MIIQNIDLGLDRIDTVHHSADIHIRNFKRHREYREVLHKWLNAIKKDTKNAVALIGGDLVHSKTDITPEEISLLSWYLKSTADVMPVVIIIGNHDLNLNNSSRLDALRPVVDALDHPNIHYWVESGVYVTHNISWTVMSILESPDNYIIGKDVPNNEVKIALHHGPVDKTETETGILLENDKVTIEKFEGYDLALLGDIHKRQFLDRNKTIAYCGSLIQQHHGETLQKGYLKWNINDLTSEFIHLHNDFGYFTIDIEGGIPSEWKSRIPNKPRLRIRHRNTPTTEVMQIVADIKEVCDIQSFKLHKIGTFMSTDPSENINLVDVRDPEIQNKLITDFIKTHYPELDSLVLDKIRYINRKINSKVSTSAKVRNIVYKPIAFTFDNMFTFGKGNELDFTKLHGSVGLFAPNKAGKSSMIDALIYCIYDKSTRTSLANEVMNTQCNSFYCKFEFEFEGDKYFIERDAYTKRNKKIKVNVNFWMINSSTGEKKNLNGDDRNQTNNIIRQYLGTYEDFILTALSPQNNHSSFIDMKQRGIKDILSQFLDIEIFSQLNDIASDDIREVASLIKEHKREDHPFELTIVNADIKEYSGKYNDITKSKANHKSEIRKVENKIIKFRHRLKSEINLMLDIDQLNTDFAACEIKKEELKNLYMANAAKITNTNRKLDKLKLDMDESKYPLDIVSQYNETASKQADIMNLQTKLQLSAAKLESYKQKLDTLSKHEYDPDCEYCINNVFVKDAESTQLLLDKEQIINDDLNLKLDGSYDVLMAHSELKFRVTEFHQLQTKLTNESRDLNVQLTEKGNIESKVNILFDKIKNIKQNIKQYNQNAKNIEANRTISDKIDMNQVLLDTLKDELIILEDNDKQIYSSLNIAKTKKDALDEAIVRLHELEQEFKSYEYYLKATHRDGIQYDLIVDSLPHLENMINSILDNIVDFSILMIPDGKKINSFIVYSDDKYWSLKLSSGMEKFISSLAIRSALLSISSLPRPDFLVVDEGFGNLDPDLLNSIYLMLDYLKTQFSFVLVISHLPAIKDLVDMRLSIDISNNFSKITN